MTFDNPEVVEIGMAEELIQDVFQLNSAEGSMSERVKTFSAIYVADDE